jgi:hypothetical protein
MKATEKMEIIKMVEQSPIGVKAGYFGLTMPLFSV